MTETFLTSTGQLAYKKCAVQDCESKGLLKGLCDRHYRRWARHGDPLGGRKPNGEAMRYMEDVVLAYEGDECLTWPHGRIPSGYGKVWVNGRTELAHRYVCQVVNGSPPTSGHEVAHSCGGGSKGCVTKRHLSWKTHLENMRDKSAHGTQNRGEAQHLAKLTEGDVLAIRASQGKISQNALARQFGVTQAAIWSVLHRTSWGWL